MTIPLQEVGPYCLHHILVLYLPLPQCPALTWIGPWYGDAKTPSAAKTAILLHPTQNTMRAHI